MGSFQDKRKVKNLIYCVAVNYGTPHLISEWASSFRNVVENDECSLYIVDNFSSQDKRDEARSQCDDLGINFIERENIGYGRALNAGFTVIREQHSISDDDIIFGGNIDISVKTIERKVGKNPEAYLPMIIQGGANRNPFMSNFQRRFVFVYDIPAALRLPILLRGASAFIKVLKIVPSKPFSCHGSIFVVNGSFMKKMQSNIFNDESFLYCEEMEFGEYLRKNNISLVPSNIEVAHSGKVSTEEVTRTRKDFFMLWEPSWRNFRKRWS